MTLFELLVWTYRDQRAHRYLRREMDWFIQLVAEDELMGDMGQRPEVHPDAAMVHGAVMHEVRQLRRTLRLARGVAGIDRHRLVEQLTDAEQRAGLVIYYAELGDIPEYSVYDPLPFGWGCDPELAHLPPTLDRLPRKPRPVEPLNRSFNRWSWATIGGERVDYAILVDDTMTVDEEDWQPSGRKRMKSRSRRIRVDIEYCPIDWSPGDEIIAMSEAMARSWVDEFAAIAGCLAGAEFRAHVLVEAEDDALTEKAA